MSSPSNINRTPDIPVDNDQDSKKTPPLPFTKLFVGQLSHQTEEHDLQAIFSPFGNIADILIIRDKVTNAHKGCAFVTFATRSEAENALFNVHDKVIIAGMRRPLQCNVAGNAFDRESRVSIAPFPVDVRAPHVAVWLRRALFAAGLLSSGIAAAAKTNDINVAGPEAMAVISEFVTDVQTEHDDTLCTGMVQFVHRRVALLLADRLRHEPQIVHPTAGPLTIVVPELSASPTSRLARRSLSPMKHAPAVVFVPNQHQPPQMGMPMSVSPTPMYPYPSAPHAQVAPTEMYPNQMYQLVQNQQIGYYYAPVVPDGAPMSQQSYPFVKIPTMYYQQMPAVPQAPYLYNSHMMPSGAPVVAPVSPTPSSPLPHAEQTSSSSSSPEREHKPRPAVARGPSGANIFVYNIPTAWTDQNLLMLFEPFGQLLSFNVFKDKQTRISRGFGFVSYATAEQANAAVQALNGKTFSDRVLKVQIKSDRNDEAPMQ